MLSLSTIIFEDILGFDIDINFSFSYVLLFKLFPIDL